MGKKETKKRVRERLEADQARFDDLTRRLIERIERRRAEAREAQERRASS
jgi:hypothetical protein